MIILEEYKKADSRIGEQGPFWLYQYVNVLLQIEPTALNPDKYCTAVEFVSFWEKKWHYFSEKSLILRLQKDTKLGKNTIFILSIYITHISTY